MDFKTVNNNVSLTGLHDMYTDFDRWMMAFNKKHRRRSPHLQFQTRVASLYDHSWIDEQFLRTFLNNINQRVYNSKIPMQFHDAEYFANYNNYILLRRCYDNRQQCFNDFRSKL